MRTPSATLQFDQLSARRVAESFSACRLQRRPGKGEFHGPASAREVTAAYSQEKLAFIKPVCATCWLVRSKHAQAKGRTFQAMSLPRFPTSRGFHRRMLFSFGLAPAGSVSVQVFVGSRPGLQSPAKARGLHRNTSGCFQGSPL